MYTGHIRFYSRRPPLSGYLVIPRTRLRLGNRAFSVAGPAAWNSLPSDIRTASTLSAFYRAAWNRNCISVTVTERSKHERWKIANCNLTVTLKVNYLKLANGHWGNTAESKISRVCMCVKQQNSATVGCFCQHHHPSSRLLLRVQ